MIYIQDLAWSDPSIHKKGSDPFFRNWLQYFFPESLEREVPAAGLEVEKRIGDVAGRPYEGQANEFAVVLITA